MKVVTALVYISQLCLKTTVFPAFHKHGNETLIKTRT